LSVPCSVRELDISNTQARLDPILEAIMRGCIYLTKLILSKNKVTKKTADILVRFMQRSDSLLHLDISSTGINGNEMSDLIMTASHNPYINGLNLYADDNSFGFIGAISITPAIRSLRGIECLSLKENDFTDEGISILSKSLKGSTSSIIKLLLDGNFKSKSAKERSLMIKNLSGLINSNLCSIRHLSIAGGNKSHSQLKQDIIPLLNSISKGKLVELNISNHKMGNSGAYALSRYLKESKSLQRLLWDENSVDLGGLASIINSVKENNSIIDLEIPISNISTIIVQGDQKTSQRVRELLNDLHDKLFCNNKMNASYDTSSSMSESDSKETKFSSDSSDSLNDFSKHSKRRSSLDGKGRTFERVQSQSATESLDLAHTKSKKELNVK